MIVSATGPLDTAAGGVHALYVALNHPVVTLDGLPVGPAAAGIAVHAGGGATLLVRSERGHGVAYFQADPAASGDDPRLGVATALAYAEGLGFLFDEERPLGAGEREQWPLWLEEIFAAATGETPETASPDASAAFLTKFRWALPGGSAGRALPDGGVGASTEL